MKYLKEDNYLVEEEECEYPKISISIEETEKGIEYSYFTNLVFPCGIVRTFYDKETLEVRNDNKILGKIHKIVFDAFCETYREVRRGLY